MLMNPITNSVVTASTDKTICEWDPITHIKKRTLELTKPIKCMASFGDYILVGQNGSIMFFDFKNLEMKFQILLHEKQINSILPVRKEIWTAGDDGMITVSEVDDSKGFSFNICAKNKCGEEKISSLAVALDGKIVISGSYKEMIVWNTKTRQDIQVIKNVQVDFVHVIQAIGIHRVWSGANSKDSSLVVWSNMTEFSEEEVDNQLHGNLLSEEYKFSASPTFRGTMDIRVED